jgi:hypothetical protein
MTRFRVSSGTPKSRPDWVKKRKSHRRRHSRCRHCSEQFVVDPRLGQRHRYCAAPDCRKAAKRASQQRWLSRPENASYFKGPANALRAKLWRAANPRRSKKPARSMQRLISPGLSATLEACGVQELNERQLALVLGVVSALARSRAQETIARRLRQLMFAGYAVLRTMESPQYPKAEPS